jgi:hypothetical protein
MTQPRLIVPTLFTALALAAMAAGCSGSSGSGSLPTASGAPNDAAARRRHPVGAILRIHIPPKPKHHKRGERYVSPNTQSITVGVQYVTASPWPSLPLQTLVVTSPTPCHTVGENQGLNCTFTVHAYAGNNVFTFNEYASKNPSPQDTPLGTLTTGVTKISAGDPALNFTLQGVVSQVALTVPNPESTQNAATKVTQTMPIGTAGSFTLYVNPKDASGASIATDTFSTPITIQVSPGNSGVSLSLDKQCTGDTSAPAKVTMNCASDLNRLTVQYDGTVTQTGANAYVDSAKIVASPQLASPTPQPATVALTSNLLSYQLTAPIASPYISGSNLALDPVSGKIVFAYSNNGSNPTFVEFDPANPSAASATHSIGFGVRNLTVDAAGHIWTNDVTSSALHCFTSISATGATVGIGDANGAINYPFVIPDGSGNMWYSGLDQSGYPAIGHFADTCAANTRSAQLLLGNNADESPIGLGLAKPVSGNAAVGMVTYGGSSNNFFTVNTATSPSPPPSPAAAFPVNEYPEGLISDKGFNFYVTSSGTTSLVSKIPAGTANISTLVALLPNSSPYGLDQYSGSQTTAQALAVLDASYGGTALINPAAASTEPLEIASDDSYECIGVTYDKTGGVWEVCWRGDGTLWAYRPIVTSTWSALPNAYPYSGGNYGTVLTIAEKSGVDNSPFTVVGNTNPSVIATAAPTPPPLAVRHGHVIAGFPHAIPVEINATGSSILTISDKNGRTQSFNIVVNPTGIIAGARHHRDRRHGARP